MKTNAWSRFQKSAIPPITRIRENQRRSRARRSELVKDLQQRLHEYEKKEVQATISMQQAARRVVWENTQLRILLVSKGVSSQGIEDFIRGRERLDSDFVKEMGNRDRHAVQSRECDDTQSVTNPPLNHMPDPELDMNYYAHTFDWSSGVEIEQRSLSSEAPNPLRTVAVAQSPPNGGDSMLEMSCETAANIIASMRGNEDNALARSELGCKGSTQCKVRNIKVLQIMERD